jgi:hypothetical protein
MRRSPKPRDTSWRSKVLPQWLAAQPLPTWPKALCSGDPRVSGFSDRIRLHGNTTGSGTFSLLPSASVDSALRKKASGNQGRGRSCNFLAVPKPKKEPVGNKTRFNVNFLALRKISIIKLIMVRGKTFAKGGVAKNSSASAPSLRLEQLTHHAKMTRNTVAKGKL